MLPKRLTGSSTLYYSLSLCDVVSLDILLDCYAIWYDKQAMCVRWGNSLSNPFHVNNGVRQGGILSPYLFNVYMDDLSQSLNCCKTGCLSGEIMILKPFDVCRRPGVVIALSNWATGIITCLREV